MAQWFCRILLLFLLFFISIYLMLNLFPDCEFLFLQLLLGYRFSSVHFLSWFRDNCSFSVKSIFCTKESSCMGWSYSEVYSMQVHLQGLVQGKCSITRASISECLCSALLSSFFKYVQQEFSHLFKLLTLCPAPLFGLSILANSTVGTTEWHTLIL